MKKQAYPLQWPLGWKRVKAPTESRFGSLYDRHSIAYATDYILEELRKFNAKTVVISTNLTLRNDGLPRSSQKAPADKGVAVYFKHGKNDQVIACDSFNNVSCNMWAVAKTIEAMRGIERWGCSELLNKAFEGFKALPDPNTKKPWYEVMQCDQDWSPKTVTKRYRWMVIQFHPDNPETGDKERFLEIQGAYEEFQQL